VDKNLKSKNVYSNIIAMNNNNNKIEVEKCRLRQQNCKIYN